MATVLKNMRARGYAADAFGTPPMAANLAPRGCTPPLNSSQIEAAQNLPGFGSDVRLWEVPDPVVSAPAAVPAAPPPASGSPKKAKQDAAKTTSQTSTTQQSEA